MPDELLDITPRGDQHPTREVTVGETVRPAWTLPVDADRDKVLFDFLDGATVTGDDLQKKALDGGDYEYRPRHGAGAEVQSTFQIVQLRYEGDPGTVDTAYIEANDAPG